MKPPSLLNVSVAKYVLFVFHMFYQWYTQLASSRLCMVGDSSVIVVVHCCLQQQRSPAATAPEVGKASTLSPAVTVTLQCMYFILTLKCMYGRMFLPVRIYKFPYLCSQRYYSISLYPQGQYGSGATGALTYVNLQDLSQQQAAEFLKSKPLKVWTSINKQIHVKNHYMNSWR